MRSKVAIHALALLVFVSLSMAFSNQEHQIQLKLADEDASRQTQSLYVKLWQIGQSEQFLFGQEDAVAYGIGWKGERWRSDVADVCGDFPAVYGWDMSKLGKYSFNIDTVDFQQMRQWIKRAHRKGGINTISWHLDNPVSGGDSWDTTPAVAAILPGGEKHDWYRNKLDLFADFVKSLKSRRFFGHRIPIIFRPFHEHTGRWFWWGKPYCSAEEYIALWRFTVDYLKDEKGVHNLLYAYSPDVFSDREHYLKFYPGDDYVDILGLDDYRDVGRFGKTQKLTERLQILVELAEEKEKVAALTETGYETVPEADWWTATLLVAITAEPVKGRIAWALVWRNARLSHHYGPYPGHKSADDFVRFYQDSSTLFLRDLQ